MANVYTRRRQLSDGSKINLGKLFYLFSFLYAHWVFIIFYLALTTFHFLHRLWVDPSRSGNFFHPKIKINVLSVRMYIEHDKGKSVLREREKIESELNIYKFYVANVLYRGAAFPFHAAMRIYDCVTFYLILCFLATCTSQINFLSSRKKVFLRWKNEKRKKRKRNPSLIHTRFRLRYSHKVS